MLLTLFLQFLRSFVFYFIEFSLYHLSFHPRIISVSLARPLHLFLHSSSVQAAFHVPLIWLFSTFTSGELYLVSWLLCPSFPCTLLCSHFVHFILFFPAVLGFLFLMFNKWILIQVSFACTWVPTIWKILSLSVI